MPVTELTTWPGATKPADVALDAGVLYVGDTPVAMGATRGGLTFDPGATTREYDFDGKMTPIAGTERVTDYKAVITGKVISMSSTLLQQLNPGSTKTTVAGPPSVDTVAPIKAGTPLDGTTGQPTSGYLSNVCLIRRLASGKIEQVIFPVARVTSYKISGTDKSEAEIDLTIQAYLASTETDLTKCPFSMTVTG